MNMERVLNDTKKPATKEPVTNNANSHQNDRYMWYLSNDDLSNDDCIWKRQNKEKPKDKMIQK